MFNSFATIYDELMDKSLYDKWLSFTNRFAPMGSKKVLDLACGTGDFSLQLVRSGFKVMGLDNSEEMLSIASSKLTDDPDSIMFVKRDMRDLTGLGSFDVVTCYDDSLNYLLDFSELESVFGGVFEVLRPGGIFLFDVITPYQTDVVYQNYYYNYSDEQNSLLWTTYSGEFEHSVIHDLTIFKYDSELKAYQRYTEEQQERAYEMWQYLDSLQAAGFKNIQTLANFGEQEIDSETKRWFFIGQKS
ncbi:class I SAM-dependent DNA methyltransferase [Xylocopilactobacillus apicola]|uniref:SAM-dependent methyltransferase n=1 Tax=Xylocopilactobacillus apicola TaxID=2932184 RepID=A0AAU9D496_9LACO|nr:class I SAM-dependent methyltransferase [Xylocopilactobacillus apicola]BDR58318.1 SAM-dependent methyltransferase [Xylocopilactobacillus apicola]